MADVFTKAKRPKVMSRIRGRGNKETELALARLLHANGISGWRRRIEIRGRAVLPRRQNPATEHRRPTNFRVRPDFVFRQARLALFLARLSQTRHQAKEQSRLLATKTFHEQNP